MASHALCTGTQIFFCLKGTQKEESLINDVTLRWGGGWDICDDVWRRRFETLWRHKNLITNTILCRVGQASPTRVGQLAGYGWMGRRRPLELFPVGLNCTRYFYDVCISNTLRIGKCFGFKQRHLLSTGNSFSWGWGDQFYAKACVIIYGRSCILTFWRRNYIFFKF